MNTNQPQTNPSDSDKNVDANKSAGDKTAQPTQPPVTPSDAGKTDKSANRH